MKNKPKILITSIQALFCFIPQFYFVIIFLFFLFKPFRCSEKLFLSQFGSSLKSNILREALLSHSLQPASLVHQSSIIAAARSNSFIYSPAFPVSYSNAFDYHLPMNNTIKNYIATVPFIELLKSCYPSFLKEFFGKHHYSRPSHKGLFSNRQFHVELEKNILIRYAKALEQRNIDLKKEADNAMMQLHYYRNQLDEKVNKCTSLEIDIKQKDMKITQLNNALEINKAHMNKYKNTCDKLTHENNEYKKNNSILHVEYDLMKKNYDAIKNSMDDQLNKYRDLEQKYQRIQIELQEQRTAYNVLENQNDAYKTKMLELKTQYEKFEKNSSDVTSKMEKEIDTYQKQYQTLENEYNGIKKDMITKSTQIRELENELKEKKNNLDEIKNNFNNLDNANKELKNNFDKILKLKEKKCSQEDINEIFKVLDVQSQKSFFSGLINKIWAKEKPQQEKSIDHLAKNCIQLCENMHDKLIVIHKDDGILNLCKKYCLLQWRSTTFGKKILLVGGPLTVLGALGYLLCNANIVNNVSLLSNIVSPKVIPWVMGLLGVGGAVTYGYSGTHKSNICHRCSGECNRNVKYCLKCEPESQSSIKKV